MRVFVALDIEDEIRARIAEFVERVRAYAPQARWVSVESLHVTLKFIGEQPDGAVKKIEEALSAISAPAIQVRFSRTGFFPTAKAARVFWAGIQADAALADLATRIDDSVAKLGIPKEQRAFSPHLTLARAAGGSGAPDSRKGDRPNRQFAVLQETLARETPPDFGTMTAREFFLYRSQLSGKGSRYSKIARFPLS